MVWGYCTTTPCKIYLLVLAWPYDGKLEVSSLKTKVNRAYLLADEKRRNLEVKEREDKVLIKLPANAPDPIDTVIVVEIEE